MVTEHGMNTFVTEPISNAFPQIPFPDGWTPPPPRLPNVSPFSLKSLKLTSYDDKGLEAGMAATGFLVELNESRNVVLVTNYHVVSWRTPEGNKLPDFGNRVPTALRIELPNEVEALTESVPQDNIPHWDIPLIHQTETTTKPSWFQDGVWWMEPNGKQPTTDVAVFPISRNRNVDLLPYTYQWHQGQGRPLTITDNLFVVGYPQSAGKFVPSTPIWTRGSVASEPEVGNPDRFFIDSRTREGQSGSPVIAYRPPSTIDSAGPAGEVEEVAILQGVYSGRTNKDSDIGSVWSMEVVERIGFQIPNQMYTHGKNPFERPSSE